MGEPVQPAVVMRETNKFPYNNILNYREDAMVQYSTTFGVALDHEVTKVLVAGSVEQGQIMVSRVVIGSRAQLGYAAWDVHNSTSDSVQEFCKMVMAYLDGEKIGFSSVTVDTSYLTEFQRDVLNTLRKVPYGAICSYSRLAELSGHDGAVRAVGSALRCNSTPLIIPCHRVVLKDGSTGGFLGRREGSDVALKRALLQLEQRSVQKCPGR